ncbi:MAG: restriction endonuclease [Chloroflexota bacterium]
MHNPKALKLQAEGRTQLKRLRRLNKTVILAQLKGMDPIVFEHLVGAVFERRGFTSSATIASGDEGVDLIVRKGMTKAVVQCKRYGDSVGQPVVRDLYGTMIHNRAKESYLVTTAMITRQARTWSKGKPIHLIDGYKLVEWIVESQTVDRKRRTIGFVIALLLMVAVFNAYLYWPVAIIERTVNGFMTTVTGTVSFIFSGDSNNDSSAPTQPQATPTTVSQPPTTPGDGIDSPPVDDNAQPDPSDAPVQIYFPVMRHE